MKRFWLMMAVVMVIGGMFFSPTCIFAASPEEGKTHVETILKEKNGKLFLYGIATDTPRLCFAYVRDGIWQALSKEDQTSVCLYLAEIAKTVKDNPRPYIDVPPTAPFFRTALRNGKNVCATCWEVSGPYDSYVLGDGVSGKPELKFSNMFKE